jgi:hypothetical protein
MIKVAIILLLVVSPIIASEFTFSVSDFRKDCKTLKYNTKTHDWSPKGCYFSVDCTAQAENRGYFSISFSKEYPENNGITVMFHPYHEDEPLKAYSLDDFSRMLETGMFSNSIQMDKDGLYHISGCSTKVNVVIKKAK